MKKVYSQPEIVYNDFQADVVIMSGAGGTFGNDKVLAGSDIDWMYLR